MRNSLNEWKNYIRRHRLPEVRIKADLFDDTNIVYLVHISSTSNINNQYGLTAGWMKRGECDIETSIEQLWQHLFFLRYRRSCLIIVDKNPAYPIAIQELKEKKQVPSGIQLRQVKYLNNIVEQENRFIKKRILPMTGLKSSRPAKRIIAGIEVMHISRKDRLSKGKSLSKIKKNSFINCLD